MIWSMGKPKVPGFTLIELVIAIAILAVLTLIAAPAFMAYLKKANVQTTRTNLDILDNAIETYRIDVGSYPETLEDIVLFPESGKVRREDWNGPYLKKAKLPVDGWKREFVYELTPGGAHAYELYSLGPNPEAEEEGRISAWD